MIQHDLEDPRLLVRTTINREKRQVGVKPNGLQGIRRCRLLLCVGWACSWTLFLLLPVKVWVGEGHDCWTSEPSRLLPASFPRGDVPPSPREEGVAERSKYLLQCTFSVSLGT